MVDKKSDYVGNHGGAYTDMDGMSRQFTYIDHSKKSKISFAGLPDQKVQARKEMTKLELLASDIIGAGLNEDREFIHEYDTVLGTKFEFWRFNPKLDLTFTDLNVEHHGEDYYNDLKGLYEQFTKRA